MSQFRRAYLHIILNIHLEAENFLLKMFDIVRAKRRLVAWKLSKYYKPNDQNATKDNQPMANSADTIAEHK